MKKSKINRFTIVYYTNALKVRYYIAIIKYVYQLFIRRIYFD